MANNLKAIQGGTMTNDQLATLLLAAPFLLLAATFLVGSYLTGQEPMITPLSDIADARKAGQRWSRRIDPMHLPTRR
jgi:hypothetical protein